MDQRDVKVAGSWSIRLISIGREVAGKLLRLEQLDDGRLLLTPVVDVPERQRCPDTTCDP